MNRLSQGLRGVFYAVLVGMVVLALFALTRPQPEPLDPAAALERTIEAGVNAQLTQIASGQPTPDLAATIQARAQAELTATSTPTPTPTATPPPSVVDQVIGPDSLIGSVWGFFGGIGWLAQALCCLLLPGLVLLGIALDPRRR